MFKKPSLDSYTIYTKSQCSYCDKVKVLLEDKNPKPVIINCDDYLVNDRSGFLSFIKQLAKKHHATFPIVFEKGVFIGGYEQTKRRIDESNDARFIMDMNF